MAYAEIVLEAAKEDGRELRDADGHLSRKQIVSDLNHKQTLK